MISHWDLTMIHPVELLVKPSPGPHPNAAAQRPKVLDHRGRLSGAGAIQKGDGWAIQLSHQFRVMTWGCHTGADFMLYYLWLLGESHITSNILLAYFSRMYAWWCRTCLAFSPTFVGKLPDGSQRCQVRLPKSGYLVADMGSKNMQKQSKTKVQGGAPIVSQVYLQVHLTDLWPISL